MFDIGFSELVLCFLVGLIVLGPQKLPAVARALGRWTGQARIYMRRLTAELERETSGSDIARDLRDIKTTVETESKAAKDALSRLGHDEEGPGKQ